MTYTLPHYVKSILVDELQKRIIYVATGNQEDTNIYYFNIKNWNVSLSLMWNGGLCGRKGHVRFEWEQGNQRRDILFGMQEVYKFIVNV